MGSHGVPWGRPGTQPHHREHRHFRERRSSGASMRDGHPSEGFYHGFCFEEWGTLWEHHEHRKIMVY